MSLKSSGYDDVDADTLLERENERLRAAELELALAQQKVDDIRKNAENIRQHIRSSGCYEADSLLQLSDGGDEHIFAHIMSYLDVGDFGPCAIVCRTLNNQTTKCWDVFDAKILIHDSLRSPSAQSCQQRVARYHAASTLARQIGAMGDHLSKHAIIDVGGDYESHYTRVEDHCVGCSLPDLNFDVFGINGAIHDEYELFVRLSRSNDNKLLAEGFTSFRAGRNGDLSLDDLDLSNWPELLEISRLAVLHGEQFGDEADHYTSLDECMVDLTAVLVAVNKFNSKACLVAAQNNFGDNPNIDSGIDIFVNEGRCRPHGYLSRSFHSPAVAGEDFIALEMQFNIETIAAKKECNWSLQCCLFELSN